MTRPQIEYTIAGVIAIFLLALLLNAIVHARAAVRDDLRKTDVTTLKRGAEIYYNQHVFYPTPPSQEPGCTEVADEDSWLFSSASLLLREQHLDAIPHDVRESRGHTYRYCTTHIESGKTNGYFFEAQLEVEQPDTIALDEDETRNFTYRILHEDGKILYRVCGGTENQCTPQENAAE
ncbi:MAG: hypothetical protein AAB538_01900 [Patescibacteria group bacterium]|mgnify:CR=1 FL=1